MLLYIYYFNINTNLPAVTVIIFVGASETKKG
jgi:hypothetical protein